MNTLANISQAKGKGGRAQGTLSAVSLFSGAGGMDVGFRQAGFRIEWANDFDKAAVDTYRQNIGDHITHGDVNEYVDGLARFSGVDCLFGGPPCQGFSVAGKMALDDPRSQLVKSYMRAVEVVRPRCFVMENVKALGTLTKFKQVRDELRSLASRLGYRTELVILNAKDFGVPQARERVFFVGFLQGERIDFDRRAQRYHCPMVSTREAIGHLGPQGSERNPKTCNAVVTIAERPVLRRSPYAGMMFNGLGRPLNPAVPCATLPASMGGNKTPIIDERQYYGDGVSWVEEYHAHLMDGGEPYGMHDTPASIRRLTLEEARILHTFPADYVFAGGKSATYRQIGNAVPCGLAHAVALTAMDVLAQDGLDEVPSAQLGMDLPLTMGSMASVSA
jgi:DNA (cytosine-5)-methyltransferase 1